MNSVEQRDEGTIQNPSIPQRRFKITSYVDDFDKK